MAPVTRTFIGPAPSRLAPLAALTAAVLAALPSPPADAAAKTPTTRELLEKIEQRDELIDDLKQRVQALERQAGRPATPPASSTSPPPPPTAAAPSPPPPPGQASAPRPKAGAAAPGQFEVDEEAAQRALERTLVITGALLLPYGQFEVQPGFSYNHAQNDFPALVRAQNGSNGMVAAAVDTRSDFIGGNVFMRLGLPLDSQLEFYVPYQSIDRETVVSHGGGVLSYDDSQGTGFGDIRLGLAKTLLQEKHWWPDVIARLTWDSDTGQTPNRVVLGSGFDELQGSITVTKRQDPLVFIGSVAYQSAFEKRNVRPGDVLSFSLGAILAASPETSLRVILNQNFVDRVEVDGDALKGTDRVSSTLNFGASSILGKGLFLDFTAGIGLTSDSPDYTVGVSLAKRFDLPFLPAL
ncbi:transporter [Methylomagnum sp.]